MSRRRFPRSTAPLHRVPPFDQHRIVRASFAPGTGPGPAGGGDAQSEWGVQDRKVYFYHYPTYHSDEWGDWDPKDIFDGMTGAEWYGVIDGVLMDCHWSQVEKVEGEISFDDNIAQTLARFEAQHPTKKVVLKVTPTASVTWAPEYRPMPQWVCDKTIEGLGGEQVSMCFGCQGAKNGVCGWDGREYKDAWAIAPRYWHEDFLPLWQNVLRRLILEYANHPKVDAIVASTMIYGELATTNTNINDCEYVHPGMLGEHVPEEEEQVSVARKPYMPWLWRKAWAQEFEGPDEKAELVELSARLKTYTSGVAAACKQAAIQVGGDEALSKLIFSTGAPAVTESTSKWSKLIWFDNLTGHANERFGEKGIGAGYNGFVDTHDAVTGESGWWYTGVPGTGTMPGGGMRFSEYIGSWDVEGCCKSEYDASHEDVDGTPYDLTSRRGSMSWVYKCAQDHKAGPDVPPGGCPGVHPNMLLHGEEGSEANRLGTFAANHSPKEVIQKAAKILGHAAYLRLNQLRVYWNWPWDKAFHFPTQYVRVWELVETWKDWENWPPSWVQQMFAVTATGEPEVSTQARKRKAG